MFPLHWLLWAKRYAQHPPSKGRVLLVLGVVVSCLMLFSIEHYIGWPSWLTATAARPPVVR